MNSFFNLFFGVYLLNHQFVKSNRVDPSGASSSKRKAPDVSTRPILISLHYASSELGVRKIKIN